MSTWFQNWFNPQILSPARSFESLCNTSVSILESGAVDEAPTLEKVLRRIATDLENERAKKNKLHRDYMGDRGVLSGMVERITPKLKSEHLAPLLTFFATFVGDLGWYLSSRGFQTAFVSFLGELEFFNTKCARETRAFLFDLWSKIKQNPASLDLLSASGQYPLLDFFVATCTAPNETGELARDFIVDMVNDTNIDSGYLKGVMYPVLEDLLVAISGYGATIDFPGTILDVVEWCDSVFQATKDFPMENVCTRINRTMTLFRKLLAYAFFMRAFKQPDVKRRLREFFVAQNIAREIELGLQSEYDEVKLSSFVLLRQLLPDQANTSVLPAKYQWSVDLVSLVPDSWLEAVCSDCGRVTLVSPRAEGTNPRIYQVLLRMLRMFPSLSIEVCENLCSTLQAVAATAPDLLNDDLFESIKSIVSTYQSISPDPEAPRGSPESRCRLLANLVSNFHKIFLDALGPTF